MNEHYLKKKIKNQGRSLKWVADNLGISLPYLSLCLKGERILSKDREDKINKMLS